MQTARIVVPTIAPGAGGVAAYRARGIDAPRPGGTLSLALRGIADVNMVENSSEENALKLGESANVVRYGVHGATATQK